MFGGLLRSSERRSVSAEEILAAVNERRLGGGVSLSSQVDDHTALRHSAVWACVRLIAGVGSTFPLDQTRRSGDTQVPVPLAPVLADPSVDVSATTWRHQLWSSLLLAGNAYGLITEFAPNGFPRRVEMLSPGQVSWHDDAGRWVTRVAGQSVDRWPNGRLWHTAIFVPGGRPFGLSPIGSSARAINTGLEAERFGGDFFAAGGHPTAVLTSNEPVTKEQAKGAIDALVEASRNRRPVAIGGGWNLDQLQINPTDSQFLETQRYTVEQIARIFGVFPEMIGAATSGSNVTYANREQRAADWLTYGLVPYLVPVEESLSSLIPRPQRVRANVSAVLRSDLKTRYESYEIGLTNRFMTVDEVRALEDRGPMPAVSDVPSEVETQ